MLAEYRTQVVGCIWGGILFFLLGWFLVHSTASLLYIFFGQLIMLGGYALFVCGSFLYAKAKGYSVYWGFLGAFPPALLVLYCLSDRSKRIMARRKKEDEKRSDSGKA